MFLYWRLILDHLVCLMIAKVNCILWVRKQPLKCKLSMQLNRNGISSVSSTFNFPTNTPRKQYNIKVRNPTFIGPAFWYADGRTYVVIKTSLNSELLYILKEIRHTLSPWLGDPSLDEGWNRYSSIGWKLMKCVPHPQITCMWSCVYDDRTTWDPYRRDSLPFWYESLNSNLWPNRNKQNNLNTDQF